METEDWSAIIFDLSRPPAGYPERQPYAAVRDDDTTVGGPAEAGRYAPVS